MSIANKLKELARPCATRPEFKAFDFWLGEWDQKNGQGQVVGTTSVKQILDGCALFEATTNHGGSYVGQAFHYFDSALGKWQQTCIDTTAFSVHWTGEGKDGEIRYTAERPGPGGAKILLRSVFIKHDADQVEQIFEQSVDGGNPGPGLTAMFFTVGKNEFTGNKNKTAAYLMRRTCSCPSHCAKLLSYLPAL